MYSFIYVKIYNFKYNRLNFIYLSEVGIDIKLYIMTIWIFTGY